MSYGTIYIRRLNDASTFNFVMDWKNSYTIPYTKYSIKETDFRIKTATFTSPVYYDLTEGVYTILISSKYHENFAGFLLDVEYDEETGLYNYQCQDFSRRYINKDEYIFNNIKLYNILRFIISNRNISLTKPTKKQKKEFKQLTSGLRALGKYDQSLYDGNIYKGNPLNQTISMISRDKSAIEIIRSLVYGSLGFFDVHFNDRGVLQIEPLSKSDWENTGLILNAEYYNRKFKFSTTNAITNVTVNGSDLEFGNNISMQDLVGLNLSAFFGIIGTSVTNPASKNTTNAVTNGKTSGKTSSKNKKTSNKNNNPFNNKKKKVWINADGGSDAMKKALAKKLKKNGWSVHIGATYSNAHYTDYFKVSKDYSVYATIYNGVCAGTLREAYSSTIQNTLKKKGVTLCVIFDTASWNNPSRHLKKHKYGDFKGCSIKKAWDDNFSKGNVAISDMDKFFKQHKARYCASPDASGVLKQFLKGGYYKYKGIKV